MVLDNDTRGWIMTCISGIACICGASIICIDIVVRLIPRFRHFEISDSDTFLSASLSLSFGVMLFSALYSMLPGAKDYLISSGLAPQSASYLLIGLFLAGVLGIQVLSRALHYFIPTHIVDCDHSHRDDDDEAVRSQEEVDRQRYEYNPSLALAQPPPTFKLTSDGDDEETPLLSRDTSVSPPKRRHLAVSGGTEAEDATHANGFMTEPSSRRPSLIPRSVTRTLTKLTSPTVPCDETGPCKGFSDLCGQDCFKAVTRRGPGFIPSAPPRQTTFPRTATAVSSFGSAPVVAEADEADESTTRPHTMSDRTGRPPFQRSHLTAHRHNHGINDQDDPVKYDGHHHASYMSAHTDSRGEHHHHVPTNAFLSIGLQTSIAIALHKAPEGFITYATNHANPRLGFAVFMALFIHNISEGFAMALPLYLALRSRTKAIIWSSFLGGLSQPLGAGIAAIWFQVASGRGGVGKPSEGVYGCMFAITAGIMASVALQLFSESLGLTHNKGVCIGFAFLGMGILGLSSALTA